MNNTVIAKLRNPLLKTLAAVAIAAPSFMNVSTAQSGPPNMHSDTSPASSLSLKQQAIAPISAATALGDMPKLDRALNQGLDAGLTLSETKEILVQMAAYAGFPRSLNALSELMKVVDERNRRGVQDPRGRDAGPVPQGQALAELGAANQTRLIGAPASGPLFEFAPVIDQFLKAHLFGAMFARDNLDWTSRELATVGALAAMPGVESQLQAHVGISMNIGVTSAQLTQLADGLAQGGHPEAADRARAALAKVQATKQ